VQFPDNSPFDDHPIEQMPSPAHLELLPSNHQQLICQNKAIESIVFEEGLKLKGCEAEAFFSKCAKFKSFP
jgi:hypothetical protein